MITNNEISRIIRIGCKAATGVGLIGAFTTDAPALAAIWGTMIYKIAKEHQVELDQDAAVKIATSVIASASAFMAGAGILTKILTYSGVATLLGLGINCAINYFYTWRLGNAFDEIFRYRGADSAISTLAGIVVKKLIPIPTMGEMKHLWDFIRN